MHLTLLVPTDAPSTTTALRKELATLIGKVVVVQTKSTERNQFSYPNANVRMEDVDKFTPDGDTQYVLVDDTLGADSIELAFRTMSVTLPNPLWSACNSDASDSKNVMPMTAEDILRKVVLTLSDEPSGRNGHPNPWSSVDDEDSYGGLSRRMGKMSMPSGSRADRTLAAELERFKETFSIPTGTFPARGPVTKGDVAEALHTAQKVGTIPKIEGEAIQTLRAALDHIFSTYGDLKSGRTLEPEVVFSI